MPDEIDQAQELAERFTAKALEDNLRGREIEANASGICIDCDEPIPPRRLRVKPNALRCVSCQEIHENWRPL